MDCGSFRVRLFFLERTTRGLGRRAEALAFLAAGAADFAAFFRVDDLPSVRWVTLRFLLCGAALGADFRLFSMNLGSPINFPVLGIHPAYRLKASGGKLVVMWLAKPYRSLSPAEKDAWRIVLRRFGQEPGARPLAQEPEWAEAMLSVGAQVYLVFSPDEAVGGVLFSLPGTATTLETVNGPLLDWDLPSYAARQLATFAQAASKLLGGYSSLVLRPRWEVAQLASRLAGIPVPASSVDQASTILVRPGSPRSKRLQRTLERNQEAGVSTAWITPSARDISSFLQAQRAFNKTKGLFCPPDVWFHRLIAPTPEAQEPGLEFRISRALVPLQGESASAELLVVLQGHDAHFLFGYEVRPPSAPGWCSPSAAAHARVLEEIQRLGVRVYDLGGAVRSEDPEHPYAGVTAFKEQFQGEWLDYAVPVLRIEA
jgi:hypothetical protein